MTNELITDNLEKCVLAELDGCKKFRIISPYVKKEISSKIGAKKIQIELITRFSESDFIQGVSDVEALEELMINGAKIRGVKDLHAKVYIFDSSAIVTSGNLTNGGFRKNHECGILTRDIDIVSGLNNYFDSFKDAQKLDKTLLNKLKKNISALSSKYKKPELPLTKDYGSIIKRRKTNYFFVNVGYITNGKIRAERNWDDCREFNFLSAGQGPKFSDQLNHLSPGDIVFAYVSTYGYVGVGKVVKAAQRVNEFRYKGKLLSTFKSKLNGNIFKNSHHTDKSEYLVELKWLDTVDLVDALETNGKYYFYTSVSCSMANQMDTVEWLLSNFKDAKKQLLDTFD